MRLVVQESCVHGYYQNCCWAAFQNGEVDYCPGGTERVVEVDYGAAWDKYYVLADRRTQPGLVESQVRGVVDAALGLNKEDE